MIGPRTMVFYALTGLLGLTRHEAYCRRAIEFGPENERAALRAILDHAAAQVPYYRDILSPDRDWVAEFGSIPVLTKEAIRENFANLCAVDIESRKWFENASGGSTGVPLRFIQDEEYLNWSRAAELFFYRRFLGVDFASTRKIVLWGSERDLFEGSIGLKAIASNWLRQTTYLNSFKMTEAALKRYVEVINARRPVFIKAYAGSIYELARYVRAQGLAVHSPRFIYSAAETLRPFMRKTIEEVFACKVHDYYGSREVGAMAGECSAGKLHVFQFNNVIEVVDSRGEPVKPGEEGRVLVTMLHNRSMPLIRYEIGDTAVRGEACSCGNRLLTLERVTGRITDHFTAADGTLVHGEYFTHLFYFRGWVDEFQVLQVEVDRIEIFYASSGEPIEADVAEIDAKIRLVMGDGCRIFWKKVDEVPRTPQGKLLFTRSLVAGSPQAALQA